MFRELAREKGDEAEGLPPRGASLLMGLGLVAPGRRDAGVGVPGDPRREDVPGEERD